MKANEFVKKFGWEEAKKKNSEGDDFYAWRRDKEFFKDLKRLVDSHELVRDYYGLTRAKEHAESNYTAPELKAALKEAIADMESCFAQK